MSNKLLYGKNLAAYDDEDIDELLSKLTDEELKELNDDLDPDNSLLPPSQRCRDQTNKAPTGPYNREKLIKFLIDSAKNEKDWEESVPYEKKTRGTVFVGSNQETQISQKELEDMGFDMEFDTSVDSALEKASEEELVDLAAVLGFTGMLNQVQFHASLENRAQECGGFHGVAKADKLKVFEAEKPNDTDVEASIKQLEDNDAKLTSLVLNNIKTISAEQIKRLATALEANTHLTELQMANTRLTDALAAPIVDAVTKNKHLVTVNLTTNFLSGTFIIQLLEAVASEGCQVRNLQVTNQRQSVLGVKAEQTIASLLAANPRLVRFGIDLDTEHARSTVMRQLVSNGARAKLLKRAV